jgi:hypothetical protein
MLPLHPSWVQIFSKHRQSVMFPLCEKPGFACTQNKSKNLCDFVSRQQTGRAEALYCVVTRIPANVTVKWLTHFVFVRSRARFSAPAIAYPNGGILRFSSVPPGECPHSALKLGHKRLPSNSSSLTYHPTNDAI